jgi:hypothetical protein
MEFLLGVLLFAIGTGLVALCLVAIPGPRRADGGDAAGHGHASH